MSQFEYIKDLAKYGLENDRDRLLSVLNELIEYSKKTKKVNFAIQLQSILKEGLINEYQTSTGKISSDVYLKRAEDYEMGDLIIEKITSDYTLENIIAENKTLEELKFFIQEHLNADVLRRFDLPVANKLLLYGPSGCGKTLASYVVAGELKKMMVVINLGAIVSSKLGETSKNLAKIFRKAAIDNSIVFLDEFDSIGKIRDYSQDHGEMKRVVNTILQLFDYLPQSSLVIAATNQKEMLDDALLRRFDSIIELSLPNNQQIQNLVELTLKNGKFVFDDNTNAANIIKQAQGLSYFSIQKTLITAIKRSLFADSEPRNKISGIIDTGIWADLIKTEKKSLGL